MALDLSALTNPYGQELAGIERNRAMAAALMQAGQQQPKGEMISGRYVAPSIAQNLNPLLQTALGVYGQKQANTQQNELVKNVQQKQADILRAYSEAETPQERFAIGTNPLAPAGIQAATYESLKPQKIGENETLYQGGIGGYTPSIVGETKPAPELRQAMQQLGINKPLNQLTPPELNSVNKQIEFNNRSRANSLTLNMPSGEERKAGFMSNILDRNILQMQNALGIDPKAVKPNVPASIVEAITGPSLLSRSMTTAQRQIVEDSQLDVLDAALTLRTGAAYTPVQLTAMRATYFPVLGDKPAAVAAKKERLETLLTGAYIASGRATPARVSASPTMPEPTQPKINEQLNVPAIKVPIFKGFEPNPTGR